ncbi:outer membrane lipoprotein carrier protein LolA [Pseudaeromonas sharmana]|uniref:Outer membrane lipoprotein carrier protein LolA n=1 Tax=Pseudaeromonas sharmana TaxID=328412 RepID=A0ABV8CN00_9GAMM
MRWLLWLLCWPVCAQADSPLTMEALQARLTAAQVQRCQFEQSRALAGLDVPLRSSGRMLFDRQLGLWWQQQQPFAMTLRLNQQRFEQQLEGQAAEVLTPQQQPQLFEFSRLMLSLFAADRAALEQAFTLTLTTGSPDWQLQLQPRQAPLDQVFSRLVLTGQQHLQALLIVDRQGGETHIRFHDCQTTPTELSDAERQLFH